MRILKSLADSTHLLSGESSVRRDRDREYLMSLKNDNLLLSHYLEACLVQMKHKPEEIHWGWDSPLSQIRGTFCGHWLSAAAHMYCDIKDKELLAKANKIVSEISRCQQKNGGRWAFPIPEKYLFLLKDGKGTWAPQYVCHKNMMGLLDMYRFAENQQALDIVLGCADWFYDFTCEISRETMSDMMDSEETGGIMEFWADLYAITGDEKHLTLMRRYERPRLADPLLQGIDVLTNMHANATIPEIHGYARAYEVTSETKYRDVVQAYWILAVDERGTFATEGQTSGEIWTPKKQQAARLGDKNQEHCVVYNMMRLAEYLFRWTGDKKYADYYEKNLYNGIFAQGFWRDERDEMNMVPHDRETTTVTYYLPMEPGSQKHWGSHHDHFWCCHCTLVQANAVHHEHIFYKDEDGLIISQFIESKMETLIGGQKVSIFLERDEQTGGTLLGDAQINRTVLNRPHAWNFKIRISAESSSEFTLKIRVPGWIDGKMQISINGEDAQFSENSEGFAVIHRTWKDERINLTIGKKLVCVSLPDDSNMVAFLDGPICLAGLSDREYLLCGDKKNPENSLLSAADERHWQRWKTGWKTYHQPIGIKFKPIYQIGFEPYTIYFPVKNELEKGN